MASQSTEPALTKDDALSQAARAVFRGMSLLREARGLSNDAVLQYARGLTEQNPGQHAILHCEDSVLAVALVTCAKSLTAEMPQNTTGLKSFFEDMLGEVVRRGSKIDARFGSPLHPVMNVLKHIDADILQGDQVRAFTAVAAVLSLVPVPPLMLVAKTPMADASVNTYAALASLRLDR